MMNDDKGKTKGWKQRAGNKGLKTRAVLLTVDFSFEIDDGWGAMALSGIRKIESAQRGARSEIEQESYFVGGRSQVVQQLRFVGLVNH